jgi:beta-phosphoglucomutase-like phosphatase (HAD superfamily)
VPPAPATALRAALVEPEGVLFDLRATRLRALRDGLAGAGIDVDALAPAALTGAAALPADEAVRVAAGPADDVTLALAAHAAERAFGDLLARGALTLRDGAADAVTALSARLRLGVVTRLRRTEAERLLAAAGFGPAFAVVVAADDRLPAGAPRGPGARHAAAVARLARHVPGLIAAQAVALVDAAPAAAAARAAGLRTAIVDPAPTADAAAVGNAGAPAGCHAAADAAMRADHPRGADVRLATLRGLTPTTLACALDLAPTPCTSPPA